MVLAVQLQHQCSECSRSGLCSRLGGQRGLGPLREVLSSAGFKGLACQQVVPGVLEVALLTLLCQVGADAEATPGGAGAQRRGCLPCRRVLCAHKWLQQPAAAVLEGCLGRRHSGSQLDGLQRFAETRPMRGRNCWHIRPRPTCIHTFFRLLIISATHRDDRSQVTITGKTSLPHV